MVIEEFSNWPRDEILILGKFLMGVLIQILLFSKQRSCELSVSKVIAKENFSIKLFL